MSKPSNYWRLIQIKSSGRCSFTDLEDAKSFFQEQFPESINQVDIADNNVQRHLMILRQQDKQQSYYADMCLHCYISHELRKWCSALVKCFGNTHSFTIEDVLPLVLGDIGHTQHHTGAKDERSSPPQYISLVTRILEKFDPERSSLSTWTNRLAKSDPEIKRFLWEHGIEFKTDWLILNQTTIGKLRRVLVAMDSTPYEIQQAEKLLSVFHDIYRSQVLSERKKSRSTLKPPTTENLTAMAQGLSSSPYPPPEEILERLQHLAKVLRQYSLQQKTGPKRMPPESEADTDAETIKQLLDQYCAPCLEESIEQVLQQWIEAFSAKKQQTKKAEKFLEALYQFHCEGTSLGNIASQLGYKAQYQVSRLLKLKDFRADVMRETLLRLKVSVSELARSYCTPEALKDLEHKIDAYLDGYLADLVEEAEREAHTSQSKTAIKDKKRLMNSLFSRTLCQSLKNRRHKS